MVLVPLSAEMSKMPVALLTVLIRGGGQGACAREGERAATDRGGAGVVVGAACEGQHSCTILVEIEGIRGVS